MRLKDLFLYADFYNIHFDFVTKFKAYPTNIAFNGTETGTETENDTVISSDDFID